MISIVSDAILENMEAFSVQLSTTDQSVELLTANTTIISILDDDSEYGTSKQYTLLANMKDNTKDKYFESPLSGSHFCLHNQ